MDRHHRKLETFDPVALAGEVASVMAPLALRRDHDINFAAPMGDHAWVEIVGRYRNRIDQPDRQCGAPHAGGLHRFGQVAQDGSMVVADDGPGFAVEILADQTKRYRREPIEPTAPAWGWPLWNGSWPPVAELARDRQSLPQWNAVRRRTPSVEASPRASLRFHQHPGKATQNARHRGSEWKAAPVRGVIVAEPGIRPPPPGCHVDGQAVARRLLASTLPTLVRGRRRG